MENIVLLPIILEAAAVFLLIGVLYDKTKHISRLADEVSRIKRDERLHERIQRQHDEFIAMLVHEMRSPLSIIRGASDLVLKEASNLSSEQISKLLEQIHTSSEGILKIVNDILDVKKIESGRFEIDKVFGNINKLLKGECVYHSALSGAKNIEIKTQLDSGVPNFNFDPERIKQVLNNLLSNALKFTHEGGIVEVKSAFEGNNAVISICDTGIGVDDADIELLFHKFTQAHNREDVAEKGTGLGLVIAKGIVEAHGGAIWYEKNKPTGSKFIFSLPLK